MALSKKYTSTLVNYTVPRCPVSFYFGYASVIFLSCCGWLQGLEPHQCKSKRQIPLQVSVSLGLPYIWLPDDQLSRSGREKLCVWGWRRRNPGIVLHLHPSSCVSVSYLSISLS